MCIWSWLCSSLSKSDASEKKQELPGCSEAKYSSFCDLNCHATSELKHQSTCDDTYQSTSDIKCQSTCDIDGNSPNDSKYQCTTDTIYQSVYVMSDQKDECIIATEVRTHIQVYVFRIYLSTFAEASKSWPLLSLQVWYRSTCDETGPFWWMAVHSQIH